MGKSIITTLAEGLQQIMILGNNKLLILILLITSCRIDYCKKTERCLNFYSFEKTFSNKEKRKKINFEIDSILKKVNHYNDEIINCQEINDSTFRIEFSIKNKYKKTIGVQSFKIINNSVVYEGQFIYVF